MYDNGGPFPYTLFFSIHPSIQPNPTTQTRHPNTQPLSLHYHLLDPQTGALQSYRLLLPSSETEACTDWPLASVEIGAAALPPGERVLAVAYPDAGEVCLLVLGLKGGGLSFTCTYMDPLNE